MSLETLLDSLIVPREEHNREPVDTKYNAFCTPSSLSSPDLRNAIYKIISNKYCESTITVEDVYNELSTEDIDGLNEGLISTDTLNCFIKSLIDRQKINQGIRPNNYNKPAICKNCGPVWLWFSGEVLGCPWCWNRANGNPIPRP